MMQIDRDVDLQPFNTLSLQAKASALVSVNNDDELTEALQWARQQQLPVVPLGEGSNVVIAGDIDALVVVQRSRDITLLEEDDSGVVLRVSAGQNWHELVRWALQHNYYGLENLALIPGTVGAAPIQNIGAYGVELERFVESVHGVQIADSAPLTLTRDACEFAYRDSVFKHELRDSLVITAVDLRLSKHALVDAAYPALADYLQKHDMERTAEAVFEAVVAIRSSRLPDPAQVPNAGSFFKNPIIAYERSAYLGTRFPGIPRYAQPDGRAKLAAAWMIDHCGWKGVEQEGVGVHPAHALVLVNHGSDSGETLLSLASAIQQSVSNTFGYTLEIEPRVYGAK
ncbi:MAG: UDP-N-acetylmuramate dehydrogenase [Halieaceae bacterium]